MHLKHTSSLFLLSTFNNNYVHSGYSHKHHLELLQSEEQRQEKWHSKTSAIITIHILPISVPYCSNTDVHSVANSNQPMIGILWFDLSIIPETTENKQFLQYRSPALLYGLQMVQTHCLKMGKVKPVSSVSQSFWIPQPWRDYFPCICSATVGSQCYLLEIETSGKKTCCASV